MVMFMFPFQKGQGGLRSFPHLGVSGCLTLARWAKWDQPVLCPVLPQALVLPLCSLSSQNWQREPGREGFSLSEWGEEVRQSSASSLPKLQELVRQHSEVTPVTAS